jgi:cysteinyl-tRNA synthetase
MIQEEFYYINKFISLGWAYTIYIDNVGEFIIAEYKYFDHIKNSIKYDIVKNKLRDQNDFVIWIPKEENDNESFDSPWGYGIPSANLYVNCMYK